MNLDLVKYLSERMQAEYSQMKDPGPVITLAREYGCPAKTVARLLTDELSKKMLVKGISVAWRYVTKEILADSARELEIDPSKIRYVFQYKKKGMIDEILTAQ
jgi:hypothetical protein